MRRFSPFFVALLLVSAVQADEAAKKIASVEGVTEYRLANGARVLLFPEASRPTITVNMTVLVGSRHEGYGETGMAHLLEHMVFKGTPEHPKVPKALQDHGASFNGTTQCRSHQLLRNPAGHRREPRVRHPARIGSPCQQFCQTRGPRLGNDRRP